MLIFQEPLLQRGELLNFPLNESEPFGNHRYRGVCAAALRIARSFEGWQYCGRSRHAIHEVDIDFLRSRWWWRFGSLAPRGRTARSPVGGR